MRFIIFFIFPFFIGSCSTSHADGINGLNEISIDGSSTVFPITEAVVEEFRIKFPNIRVSVGVSGTGGGFQKFHRGDIDISNASRVIKADEKDACSKNNVDFIQIPVALDGLAVIVNKENTWIDSISTDQLKSIWKSNAASKLNKWNQIDSLFPPLDLHLFGPGKASGTYDYFAEKICGENEGTRPDYTASEDDNYLVRGVSKDISGLGFFGLAYYKENKDKLKVLALSDGGKAYYPTEQNIIKHKYQPLTRKVYIYVNANSAKRERIQQFVLFYLENAEKLSKEVGYIPLNKQEYQNEVIRFKKFCLQK